MKKVLIDNEIIDFKPKKYYESLTEMLCSSWSPDNKLNKVSLKSMSHDSFGNYAHDIGMTNIEKGCGIRERFDFGGHKRGNSGPHLQYDLINKNGSPVGHPRPLGQSTDRINLGQKKDFGYSVSGQGVQRKLTKY